LQKNCCQSLKTYKVLKSMAENNPLNQTSLFEDLAKTTGVEVEYLEEIADIIKSKDSTAQAWLFGSRARGCYEPCSDIDIAVNSPTQTGVTFQIAIGHMKSDFENSEIPYLVDIHNWREIKQSWKSNLEDQLIPLI